MSTKGFISKAIVRINNKYGCTVASKGKEYWPEVNRRIDGVVRRINKALGNTQG